MLKGCIAKDASLLSKIEKPDKDILKYIDEMNLHGSEHITQRSA